MSWGIGKGGVVYRERPGCFGPVTGSSVLQFDTEREAIEYRVKWEANEGGDCRCPQCRDISGTRDGFCEGPNHRFITAGDKCFVCGKPQAEHKR